MTHVADEMKVARMTVGRLETGPAFPKIDLAGDAGVDHPLERAVDGGATDPRILLPNEIAEVVRAQMPFLAQKEIEDAVAFAGTLAAGRTQAGKIQGERYSTLNDDPQPQVDVALGFLMVNPPPVTVSTKSTSAPFR